MKTLVISSVINQNNHKVKACLPKSLVKFKEEQGNKTEKEDHCAFTVPDLNGDKGTRSWKNLDQKLKNDYSLQLFPKVSICKLTNLKSRKIFFSILCSGYKGPNFE